MVQTQPQTQTDIDVDKYIHIDEYGLYTDVLIHTSVATTHCNVCTHI